MKAQREPVLCDFHMVGSAYNNLDPWENLLIPKTSEGKKAENVSGAKLTYRNYLQDAKFAVILQVPISLMDDLANALKNPVWDIYLGRKNCVPTDFIYRGSFSTENEARAHALQIAQEKKLRLEFQVLDGERRVLDQEPESTDLLTEVQVVNDVPLQFGAHKQYRDRYITVVYEPASD